MLKNQIRKKTLKNRESKYPASGEINIIKILKIIKKLNIGKAIIGCYYPVNFEINTKKIMNLLEKKKLTICLPIIKDNFEMEFHEYKNTDIPIVDQGHTGGKIIIGNDVWVGANTVITRNTNIGSRCIINAGSVVTRDVPDFGLITGNPGKLTGWVNEKGDKIKFHKNGKSQCKRFFFNGENVKLMEKI